MSVNGDGESGDGDENESGGDGVSDRDGGDSERIQCYD